MSINLKHPELNNAVQTMLQGLAFHMAYCDSVPGLGKLEHEFVEKAFSILSGELGRQNYYLVKECLYRKLPCIDAVTNKEEADLVIGQNVHKNAKKNTEDTLEDVLCVMEFKISTDTNGNVFKDANKLLKISENIDRLAIILFLGHKKNDKLRDAFVNKEKFCKYRVSKEGVVIENNKDGSIKNPVTNFKGKRSVDLQKIENEMKRKNTKRFLNTKIIVRVKRVTKAYSTVTNSYPYMAVCVSI